MAAARGRAGGHSARNPDLTAAAWRRGGLTTCRPAPSDTTSWGVTKPRMDRADVQARAPEAARDQHN
jgi:hypothetical protein